MLVGVSIPQKMAAIGSQGSFITNRYAFVVGLDDLNIFNEGSSLVNPPVLYNITINSEGTQILLTGRIQMEILNPTDQ